MPRLFISHSSQDQSLVESRIVRVLSENQIDCFFSRDSIMGAQEWEKRIREGLESCPWFLVALSEHSVQSPWVQAEVGWALSHRRGKVIPILLSDCDPAECNLRLMQIQYVDYREDDAKAGETIVKILQSGNDVPAADGNRSMLLSDRPSPGGNAKSPNKSSKALPIMAGAGVVLLAVSGLLLALMLPSASGIKPLNDPSTNANNTTGRNSSDGRQPAISTTDNQTSQALAEPATGPTAPTAVQVSVTLAKKFELPDPVAVATNESAEPNPFKIAWNYDKRDATVLVDYSIPYLEALRKGGPIEGVSSRPYEWEFPQLSVQTLNNSVRSVLLTECVIDIRISTINREPIISVADESLSTLIFLNDGWGEVLNPLLTFKLTATDGGEELLFAVERHTLELKTFDEVTQIPISEWIPERLQNESVLVAEGTLEYGEVDHRQQIAFRTRIRLDSYPGEPSPPKRTYDVFLESGIAPATVRVPLNQLVKTTDSDHFVMRVGSDKSCDFDTTFHFFDAGGLEIAIQHIELKIFVPRLAAHHIQRSEYPQQSEQ